MNITSITLDWIALLKLTDERLDRQSLQCDNKINQVFFILTARELSVSRKDLPAPNLVGSPRSYQWSEPLSCATSRQPTIYVKAFGLTKPKTNYFKLFQMCYLKSLKLTMFTFLMNFQEWKNTTLTKNITFSHCIGPLI